MADFLKSARPQTDDFEIAKKTFNNPWQTRRRN
jgi:hypothetical protein